MGTCIICGADVDGPVCESHEEDVCFVFEGSTPDQLTPGRYYRGTVDGFADFGVFVNIGPVTGLLHTSELDRRLESLDWEPGDEVYVQVKNVRENGNVDLGWSIRQHESEFRGVIVDSPEGDRPLEAEAEAETEAEPVSEPDSGAEPSPTPRSGPGEGTDAAADAQAAVAEERLERTRIDALPDHVGAPVRIEGRVVEARQTSGPTVFEVRDETGTVECAAFESAGVRAYPEVDAGDVVRLDGEVEERRGDIQVETAEITVLDGDERADVERRIEDAIEERARPGEVDLLADHPGVEAVRGDLIEAATAIRRAVFEDRPVVVRHSATTDGYVAGAAIERAALSLIRGEHEEADAEYHYFDRRPLDGRIYGMGDAMRDTTSMLDARERHNESIPLFVFANAASTEESRDGLELLELYGAPRVVIDGDHPDEGMADAADAFVGPHPGDAAEDVSTTALCANVAAHVDDGVRDELRHLPAVSYARGVPEAYAGLAAAAGYDPTETETLYEAVALEAFYQAYEDKRELIADVLFGETDLAGHASEQFRERVDREVRTAEPHLDRRPIDGAALAVLDTEAYTHRYDFPPAGVLLAELADSAGLDVIVGAGEDELAVWSDRPVDMRAVGERAADAVPDGGVETRGGRDGSLAFLSGAREAVIDAAVDAIAEQL